MEIKSFEYGGVESNFFGKALFCLKIIYLPILLIVVIIEDSIMLTYGFIGALLITLLANLSNIIKFFKFIKKKEEIFIDEEKILLIKKSEKNFDKINMKFESIKKIIRLNDSDDKVVYQEIMNNKDIKFLIMANREKILIEYGDKIIKIGLGWNEEQIKLFLDIVISKNKNIIIERF